MVRTESLGAAGRRAVSRRAALTAAVGAGATLALGGLHPSGARAAGQLNVATCHQSVTALLNAALAVERLATTFYYTGLTSPAIVGSSKVAGSSGDLNAVAPDGNPQNTANLQAALDQEQHHALLIAALGGVSPFTRFFFPAQAFEELGHTTRVGSFLWVLDHLETACIGFYLAQTRQFGTAGQIELALLAVRHLGVECEHRALYRLIAGDDPADNVTTEVSSFGCADDAVALFAPYLSGQGFPKGPVVAADLPNAAQTAGVVGKNTSTAT